LVKIYGNPAHWALFFGLNPLEEAFIMEKVAALQELVAVEERLHTNYADFVARLFDFD
jgi:hypothetical protein